MVLVASSISGCSHSNDWQQTYESCKQMASAMSKDQSGMLKPPNCERIQELCSSDPNSSDCKNELANYSTK